MDSLETFVVKSVISSEQEFYYIPSSFSVSRTLRVTFRTESRFSEIESIPCFTRNSAISG